MAQVFCPVIVGRDAELEILERAANEAASGHGGLFVVSGEAGIGKSRLVGELVARARARDMVVGAGRGIEATSRIPFRPIGEAVQSVVREIGPPTDPDLAPFRAALGPFIPEWRRDDASAADARLVMLEGLRRLLSTLAGDCGLVLILDDLQWADSDTLAAVDYLAGDIETERILCVCTERVGAEGPPSELLAALVGRRVARRLRLERLSDDAVAEMSRASLGADSVSPAVVDALRQRAEGVPFLVEEMLSAYVSAGGTPRAGAAWWMARRAAESLPPSLIDLVRTRLASLDDEARGVVRAAAILGRTFDWALLVSIRRRDEEAVLSALRAGVGAGLLVAGGGSDPDAFSFRHALVREAVLTEMLPPERAELALVAAEVIEDERPGLPGEWCERAAELREQGGDVVGAVRLLQESARRALARGALASAEANLRWARELGAGDHTLWFGTDQLLVEVFARAGNIEELVTLSKDSIGAMIEEGHPRTPSWLYPYRHPGEPPRGPVERLAGHLARSGLQFQPRRVAEFHLRVAHAAFLAAEPALAGDHLARARSVAGDDDVTRARARALAAALALAGGDGDRAQAQAGAALAEADELGLDTVAYEALETIGTEEASRGDLEGAAATFSRLAGRAAGAEASPWRVRALAQLGAIRSLTSGDARMLEEARRLATDIGAVSTLAAIELDLAWHHLGQGRRDQAEPLIDRVTRLCETFGLRQLPQALVVRAAWCALGDRESDMDEAISQALDEGVARPEVEVATLGEARAVLALVREDHDTARAHLDEAATLAARWHRGPPWFLGLRLLLHSVHGRAGTTAQPNAFPHPAIDAFAAFARAVLLGRDREHEQAQAEFSRADALMPPGWRHHVARRIVAEAALADGWGEPGRWAQEGLAYFDGSGFPRIANACKRLMRKAGVPVPRAGRGSAPVPEALQAIGVTSREMDVLLLVAEGLSNAEIGQRLFLSPRTIETHVKSLMRRSQTSTRVQLVAFAARHTATPDPTPP